MVFPGTAVGIFPMATTGSRAGEASERTVATIRLPVEPWDMLTEMCMCLLQGQLC